MGPVRPTQPELRPLAGLQASRRVDAPPKWAWPILGESPQLLPLVVHGVLASPQPASLGPPKEPALAIPAGRAGLCRGPRG